MTMKLTRFVVDGKGPFPLDMLRRDRCFPATEGDSSAIAATIISRRITLYSVQRSWNLTKDRWASFGWRVIEVEGE